MKPLLIVVSAPSGAGKSTLCDMLMDNHPEIRYSVSCTTRAPRGTEQDGVDYHFLSEEEFKEKVSNGEFLEHAEVHGNFYGTLSESVRNAFREGHSVIMDIDVQGADQVRGYLDTLASDDPVKLGFVDIFIQPPSLDALKERLLERGEDAEDVIAKRMQAAAVEMSCADKYKYVITNDELDQAYSDLKNIYSNEAL